MIGTVLIISTVVATLMWPIYVLLMAGVLRFIGVQRDEIAKWALQQARRQHLVELLRAIRGSPRPANEPPSGGEGVEAASPLEQ